MSCTEIFYIEGVPVLVGFLPSGDVTVRRPSNDHVRAVVEPICRENGRWEGHYKNWTIFRQFGSVVLEQLRRSGRSWLSAFLTGWTSVWIRLSG